MAMKCVAQMPQPVETAAMASQIGRVDLCACRE